MENCVAPGLDEFDVIIRSCIVFSQSSLNPNPGLAFQAPVESHEWFIEILRPN